MKHLNIYKIINEIEETKVIDSDNLDDLFHIDNKVLFQLIVKEKEKTDIAKVSELIIKNKDEFYSASKDDELDDFYKDINKQIKKIIKTDKKEFKKEFLGKIEVVKNSIKQAEDTSHDTPNVIIFKLFLREYNTKYSFTWRAFKEVKREYEKSHVLEGENIYSLKSLLERDPKIDKVTNTTVFCKSEETLSDSIIEKIKNKIG